MQVCIYICLHSYIRMYMYVRGCARICWCARKGVKHVFIIICMYWLRVTAFWICLVRSGPAAQAVSERRFQALPASARSPACSQVFPSTLAILPCSPTANSSITATATATRPATIRFPDVSVSSSFSLLLSDRSYYFICDVFVE